MPECIAGSCPGHDLQLSHQKITPGTEPKINERRRLQSTGCTSRWPAPAIKVNGTARARFLSSGKTGQVARVGVDARMQARAGGVEYECKTHPSVYAGCASVNSCDTRNAPHDTEDFRTRIDTCELLRHQRGLRAVVWLVHHSSYRLAQVLRRWFVGCKIYTDTGPSTRAFTSALSSVKPADTIGMPKLKA
jgi:hypothetical protein